MDEAPRPVLSISTSPATPRAGHVTEEVHVPSRPRFGRLDSTRLHGALSTADLVLERRLEGRLRRVLRARGATGVHLVLHGPDFWPAWRAARSLGLPVFISLHDHLAYVLRERLDGPIALRRIGPVWRGADERFAISEAIGRHHAEVHGEREFTIVTDGVEEIEPPTPRVAGRCTVYFMGAFHTTYADNLRSLLSGMELHRAANPEQQVSLTMRSGGIFLRGLLPPTDIDVRILPFAAESDARADLTTADVLWLPLPFGSEREDFVRYSLSTKLVSYVASGVPILYHGPAHAAAAAVLSEADAAAFAVTLSPESVVTAITTAGARREELARNASVLARQSFMLAANRERFWSRVEAKLATG